MKMRSGLRGLFFRRQARKEAAGTEEPGIGLSQPLVIALGILLACAVAWSFFIGFMVGRGENPREGIQSMTGLISKGGSGDPSRLESAESQRDASQKEVTPAEPQAEKVNAPAGLEAAGMAAASATANAQTGAVQAAGLEPAPAQAEKVSAGAAQPAKRPREAKKPREEERGARRLYDFSYQVGAFRGAKDAARAIRMLEKNGLRALMRKSGRVQLVLINQRGTAGDAAKLRRKLESLKLGKPLLLSKKPVQAKNSARKTK